MFEQTYTRFLDLQKAEAQAREAQVEAALERVRARAMAMHTSAELAEVVGELRKQMGALGQKDLETCVIHLHDETPGYILSWAAIRPPDAEGDILETTARIPKTGLLIIEEALAAYDAHQQDYIIRNEGRKLEQWFSFLQKESPEGYQKLLLSASGDLEKLQAYWSFADFSGGALLMVTMHPPDEPTRDLLRRFANVFGLAYKRFADLKKAEAQARESEIQLALERIRARTMAMQKSDELADTAALLFQQFRGLGQELMQMTIGIVNEEKNCTAFSVTEWSGGGAGVAKTFELSNDEPTLISRMYACWKDQRKSVVIDLTGQELEDWLNYRNAMSGVTVRSEDSGGRRVITSAPFSRGHLSFSASVPPEASSIQLLERFAAVFDGTYTRFLDLQKAEAQAKESQIQLALERVRARTMAMQRSDELADAAVVLFQQFAALGETPDRISIGIVNEQSDTTDVWATDQAGTQMNIHFRARNNERTTIARMVKEWKEGKKSTIVDLQGENLKDWIIYLRTELGMAVDDSYFHGRRLHQIAFFSQGWLNITTLEPLPADTLDLLNRFAAVFNLTYTRFLDLKNAEAQAKEAKIEASLEKVRSRTLAMQKSDELAETAAVLFQQLIVQGIEPNRLYIGIIKSDEGDGEFWLTDEDGTKVSTAFSANMNNNASLKKMLEGWRRQEKSLVIDMQGEELQNYFRHLISLGVPFKGGLEQTRRIQEIAYFSNGFIGMASPTEQPPETLQLLERFAAVFNLTFTRFNDLQVAEAHAFQAEQDLIAIKEATQKAEEAFVELQATQKQLVQSEKMASLGELTAGIAHEIQNPLNFVNNFSDVSKELIVEMMEEVKKGNTGEIKALADDLAGNLDKIHFHGQRAASIVKGMLQHSKGSSGQKELVDINALCDEYLRLAYHGLRARDKSFHAKFATALAADPGQIKVVTQDMGRVLLNLINNAFYAVNEKARLNREGYEPTVTISTANEAGNLRILVKDNGTGIPQKVKDKIFQPFFTTKPTGQGTGLGLSLSYDIVKAHGGELKVETKEGEGSEFIIQLPV